MPFLKLISLKRPSAFEKDAIGSFTERYRKEHYLISGRQASLAVLALAQSRGPDATRPAGRCIWRLQAQERFAKDRVFY